MGRVKGSKNKATKAIKEMIEGALSAVGGQKYLEQQAKDNPAVFLTLVGKILPKNIESTVEHTGEVGVRLNINFRNSDDNG